MSADVHTERRVLPLDERGRRLAAERLASWVHRGRPTDTYEDEASERARLEAKKARRHAIRR